MVFSASALANYECKGKLAYFGVDNGLHISNGYGIHKLCSFNVDGQKDKCKAWMSLAMSAQAQGKEIVIYYQDNTGKSSNYDTCAAVGNWVTPSDTVYFLRIVV